MKSYRSAYKNFEIRFQPWKVCVKLLKEMLWKVKNILLILGTHTDVNKYLLGAVYPFNDILSLPLKSIHHRESEMTANIILVFYFSQASSGHPHSFSCDVSFLFEYSSQLFICTYLKCYWFLIFTRLWRRNRFNWPSFISRLKRWMPHVVSNTVGRR